MSLHVTKITSIGAVEDGDNPESRIALFKSRVPVPDRPTIKEPQVAEPTIEELQALIVEKDAEIAALTDTEEAVEVSDPVIQKRLDDQAAEIATIQKQADDAASELATERDERADVEVAEFTKAHKVTLGDDDDVTVMVKSLHGTDVYGWLGDKLTHIEAVLAKSDLLKEVGVVDESDAKSQIQTLAVEKQKDNSELTIEQARLLVRKERPDLRDLEREGN